MAPVLGGQGVERLLYFAATVGAPVTGLFWILLRKAARAGVRERVAQGCAAGFVLFSIMALYPTAAAVGQATGMLVGSERPVEMMEAGQRLPRLVFQSLEGADVFLEDKGFVYVVNFWATWCAPCLIELPELLEWHRTLSEESGIELLTVNTEGLPREQIESFLTEKNLTGLPVYYDRNEFKPMLGFKTIPVTLVIKDGLLLSRHVGYSRSTIGEIAASAAGAAGKS
jgi:thiol-disulfide isomerase/thioredoxin